MAFTNKTANYGLPQWIDTDKPTFLGDMNGAYSKIDIAMSENKTMAETANAGSKTATDGLATVSNAIATTNTNVSALQTLTNSINAELADNVTKTTANATAIEVNKTNIATLQAQSAKESELTAFKNYFNLSNNGLINPSSTFATMGTNAMRYVMNSDNSLGKIYGSLLITPTATGTGSGTIETGIKVKASGTAYGISGVGLVINANAGGYVTRPAINVAADGSVTISLWQPALTVGTLYEIQLFACLYFFENFGD